MNRQTVLTKDALKIDARQWCSIIEDFIKVKFSESYAHGIVVTISGGLDSSVTAALCARAIGKENVVGLMLPERWGNPEANYYGRMIVSHLGIETKKISISPVLRGLGTSGFILPVISGREYWKDMVMKIMHQKGYSTNTSFLKSLKGQLDPWMRKNLAKIKSRHRARVLAVYKYADENNYMVAGSAHKTEDLVGLFVKYGVDDCADIMPLKNMYRSHILQLAEYMGVPSEIIQRTPNPDIIPGITDKYMSYFNMDALRLDLILYGLEKEMTTPDIANQLGIDEQSVIGIQEVIQLTEQSRNHAMAPFLRY